MPNRFSHFAFAAIVALTVFVSPSSAQFVNTAAKPDFNARLIVGGADRNDPSANWLGLAVRLGPGWHTYWRSAGDAGAPPEFDWSSSTNIDEPTIEWPAPRRFSDAGIDSFGYADEVVLPIKVRVRDSQKPADVSLKLALYVCSTICTRNDLSFDARITPGQRSGEQLGLIDRWRTRVPRPHSPNLAIRSLDLQTANPGALRIEATSTSGFAASDVFVDGDDAILAGHPKVAMNGANEAVITVPIDGVEKRNADKPLRVTLVAGGNAVEATVPAPQAPAAVRTGAGPANSAIAGTDISKTNLAGAGHAEKTTGILPILAAALIGGFILNFMPCVFPVLSLKMMSLLGQTSRDMGALRIRFIASAAGVITSFVLLATALAALKSAGAQIGWGIQFQQPLFLGGMAAILVALSANLLDLYEIRLPWRLGNLLGRSGGGQSVASYFFNGFIMTLLATPCSAPFVGTAVGFALSQGTWQILAIFAALGVGMASPYLALALVPQVARLFPRPGRWMQTLRQLAALAMAGAAIWLLWILSEISGSQTAVIAGTALGLMVWAVALYQRRHAHAIAGVVMASLAATAILIAGERTVPTASKAADGVPWQTFAPPDVATLVRSGHTVFVDIGAAWCVTCKVNERLIINSSTIRQRLLADVVPLQGDWTKPDPTIAAYLKSFGRFGLPFNAVFGPGAPDGIVLPELLTQQAVLAAFDAASTRP